MTRLWIRIGLAALLCSAAAIADGPAKEDAADAKAAPAASADVEVLGDLPKTGKLTVADLEALGPESAKWSAGGKSYTALGVPLWKVLDKFGFSAGGMSKGLKPADKRAGWKKVLVVTARDGFQAVFSCAELFPSVGRTRALLVFKLDGQPLPADTGPMRIAPLSDKEASRAVYGIARLQVYDLSAERDKETIISVMCRPYPSTVRVVAACPPLVVKKDAPAPLVWSARRPGGHRLQLR